MENKGQGRPKASLIKWKIETQQKDIDFLRRENARLNKKLAEALEKRRENAK